MLLVGILEDNESLRSAMVNYLHATSRFHCLFQEASITNIPSSAKEIIPDVILLDIHLDDGPSLSKMDSLHKSFPESKIIVITGDMRDDLMVQAIELGVRGYVRKPFSMGALVQIIETVADTGAFLAPDLLLRLMNAMNKQSANCVDKKNTDKLTPQESRIVALLRDGFSYKEIATVKNISYHTVNQHIKNIYKKLDIKSKYELLRQRKPLP